MDEAEATTLVSPYTRFRAFTTGRTTVGCAWGRCGVLEAPWWGDEGGSEALDLVLCVSSTFRYN